MLTQAISVPAESVEIEWDFLRVVVLLVLSTHKWNRKKLGYINGCLTITRESWYIKKMMAGHLR